MPVPAHPKIYHIIHVDRIASVVSDGFLWSDAEAIQRRVMGTIIGINDIKQQRLRKALVSHESLCVGDCVPFNFCPKSVMLYVIYKRNHPDIEYRGGQTPIVHLEADLHETVNWADANNQCWAFTASNAASRYSEEYSDIRQLDKIFWDHVAARSWSGDGIDPLVEEHKQAEFLVERAFPWELVSRIGIQSQNLYAQLQTALAEASHRPVVEVKRDWYYP